MPVLFIHGVNTREESKDYASTLEVIKQLMQTHFTGLTINGKTLNTVDPVFPYWGDLGTSFFWNMASLPSLDDHQSLGAAGTEEHIRLLIAAAKDGTGHDILNEDEPLAALAKSSFPQAVEVVCDLLMNEGNAVSTPAQNATAIIRLQEYVDAHARPDWVDQINTDEQFLNQLLSWSYAHDNFG